MGRLTEMISYMNGEKRGGYHSIEITPELVIAKNSYKKQLMKEKMETIKEENIKKTEYLRFK